MTQRWYTITPLVVFLSLSFGLIYMYPYHYHSWVVEFQFHNRGHSDTRLCPSNVFNTLSYTLCLHFLPVFSYRSVCSPYLYSSPSAADTTCTLTHTRSIPSCSHHHQATQAPGLRTVFLQRSIIIRIIMYYTSVLCLFKI